MLQNGHVRSRLRKHMMVFQIFIEVSGERQGQIKTNKTKPQVAASWRVIRGEKEIQHI